MALEMVRDEEEEEGRRHVYSFSHSSLSSASLPLPPLPLFPPPLPPPPLPPLDNVHFQHTAQLVQALTEQEVQFRLQVTVT